MNEGELFQEISEAALETQWPIPNEFLDMKVAVCVLSAPPTLDEQDERRREGNAENCARIRVGMVLAAMFECPLILNGETEQLPTMQAVAEESGATDVRSLDCGRRGVGNTLTQLVELRQYHGEFEGVILVTSGYHVPRVGRTAGKQLPGDIAYVVVGVPLTIYMPDDLTVTIRGEMQRIKTYVTGGDLLPGPCISRLPV